MGDISAEPSMEEILSSIKRIIAEEGDGSQPRARRPHRAAPPARAMPVDHDDEDDAGAHGNDDPILELSDPMPTPEPTRPRAAPVAAAAAAAPTPTAPPADAILSQETAAASRGALETLSKLMVKPDPGSDGTLEGLVRDMLRPMLRDWLDANLPDLVETLVAHEIEKITGQRR